MFQSVRQGVGLVASSVIVWLKDNFDLRPKSQPKTTMAPPIIAGLIIFGNMKLPTKPEARSLVDVTRRSMRRRDRAISRWRVAIRSVRSCGRIFFFFSAKTGLRRSRYFRRNRAARKPSTPAASTPCLGYFVTRDRVQSTTWPRGGGPLSIGYISDS